MSHTMTRSRIGVTGGRDCNDWNGCRYVEVIPTGPITCTTVRALPAGRAYQERAVRWIQRGPWQVRDLHIEDGWTIGGNR